MSLRIYNTLARELEEFSPLEPGHVRMYVLSLIHISEPTRPY